MRGWKNILLVLLAVVVGLQIVGLVALAATGRLNGQKLDLMAKVIGGRFTDAQGVLMAMAGTTASPEAKSQALEAAPTQPTPEQIGLQNRDKEMIEQLVRNMKIQAQLTLKELKRREEKLRLEKEAWDKKRKQQMAEQDREGFEAVRDIVDTMRPRDVKRYLMTWPEDVVVRLLRDMDDRKVGQILAECKTPEEQARAAKLMMRLRQGA
jgi:flagellar motility protein MotE (MotC chaperone)